VAGLWLPHPASNRQNEGMLGKLDSTLTVKGGKDRLVTQHWYLADVTCNYALPGGHNIHLCALRRQGDSDKCSVAWKSKELCAFCWVITRSLNFICRRFGTLFHRHRQVLCFLMGNSPSSEFYMPTFRNTVCCIFIGRFYAFLWVIPGV